MFVFGHLGIGSGLVLLAKRDLPMTGIFAGTLAPDLLDKPIFYGLVRTHVLPSTVCAWLPGTRTVGHTLLAVALVALLAALVRGRPRAWLQGAALGMASHDLLDIASDAVAALHGGSAFTTATSGAWRAAFFPFAGTPFCTSLNVDLLNHFLASLRVHLVSELLGVALLGAAVLLSRRPGVLRSGVTRG
jgi:hypothetical protein